MVMKKEKEKIDPRGYRRLYGAGSLAPRCVAGTGGDSQDQLHFLQKSINQWNQEKDCRTWRTN